MGQPRMTRATARVAAGRVGARSGSAGARAPQVIAPAPARVATRSTRAAIGIVAVYLFAKMFYVSRGGSAQPADIMMCVLAFFVVPPRTMFDFLKAELALTLLVVWVALVNLAWFVVTNNPSSLPPILYFLFNLMIVLTFYGVRKRDPALFDRVICLTIIAAVAVQTTLVFAERFIDAGLMRNSGTFRNPNQLAYWGILMLSLLLMLRRNRLSRIDMMVVAAATFCEFASASRAGLAALVALLVMWLYFALASGRKRTIACLGVIAAGVLLSLSPAMDRVIMTGAESSAVGSRMVAGDQVSQFDERQYNRIIDFYQYTLLGAGEGNVSRFLEDNDFQLEIHSSFGTMLFSYGIPGLGLFCLLLYRAYRQLPMSLGLYLLPSLLYGVTHQGLRFTLFWGLIGVALALGDEFSRRPGSAPARALRRLHEARGPEFLRTLAGVRQGSRPVD